MDERKDTIEAYNRLADGMYSKYAGLGARKKEIDGIFAYFNGKNDPSVLEIGCAYGREAEEILKLTRNYIGIDVSRRFIEIARQRLPGAKFEVADVVEYEFPSDLDMIFSFASLLHSSKEEIERIIGKCRKALNPGGILYLNLKYGEYRKEITDDEFGRRVFYYYTPADIRRISTDFEVLFEREYMSRGKKWFDIALRKPTSSRQ